MNKIKLISSILGGSLLLGFGAYVTIENSSPQRKLEKFFSNKTIEGTISGTYKKNWIDDDLNGRKLFYKFEKDGSVVIAGSKKELSELLKGPNSEKQLSTEKWEISDDLSLLFTYENPTTGKKSTSVHKNLETVGNQLISDYPGLKTKWKMTYKQID
ncbi:hypothetical protein B9D04_09600 [Weissella cibaria]|uniref:Uncharacterized protein n=1 Tax=Weissella cibaria TaxID=137591 RepID=A0A1X4JJQ5_9LACO|nr:hypothetical protein [Weissella cibaria]OSP88835.1 hypothetical protein B9D04_09600 [Weissella cibaria]